MWLFLVASSDILNCKKENNITFGIPTNLPSEAINSLQHPREKSRSDPRPRYLFQVVAIQNSNLF
jgi:hypothetical protein